MKVLEDEKEDGNLNILLEKEGSENHLSRPLNKLKQTVFHFAIMVAPNSLIDALLKHADKDMSSFVDINGMNPVHYAARSLQNGCLKTCLEYGLNALNSQSKTGMTPLMYAVEDSVLNTAFLLLKYEQVDVSIRDDQGNNVLFYIAKKFPKHYKDKEYERLLGIVLHHKTFNAKMLTQPNNDGVSIIEDVARKDLIIMLLMIGQGKTCHFQNICIFSLSYTICTTTCFLRVIWEKSILLDC